MRGSDRRSDAIIAEEDARGWNAQRILAIIFIVLLTEQAVFAFQLVTVALPDISQTFDTTQISWVSVLTGLVGAVTAPLIGKLADIHGKKKLLVIASLGGIIGGLFAALATAYWMLLLGRALQGLTFVAVGLSFSLVRDIFPPKIMPFAASLTVTGVGAITIIQPFLSGYLVDAFGFRGVFWFLVIYSTISVAGVMLFADETRVRAKMRVDWVGAVLLGGGIALFMLALSMGTGWGWFSLRTLGCFAAGIALVIAWIEVDRRIDDPLVDLKILKSRPVATTILMVGTFYGAAGALATVIPLMAMTPREIDGTIGFGTTALGAAMYFLPLGLGTVVIGFIMGSQIRKTGARTPAIAGVITALIGALLLIPLSSTIVGALCAISLLGIGQGLTYAAFPNLLIQAAPEKQQAVTASMMTSFQGLMPTVVVQIAFVFLTIHISSFDDSGVTYSATGYHIVFGMAAAFFALSLIAALALPHGRRLRTKAEDASVTTRKTEDASGATPE